MIHWKQLKLESETSPFVTSEKGNSMVPLIYSGQDHELTPVEIKDVKAGDIVFCKFKGKYYTHKVYAVNPLHGVLIGNAKGKRNGWTKQVYGKVTKIFK